MPGAHGLLTCPIRPRERAICDELKRSLGIATDENLIRSALYHYAAFVLGNARVDVRLFELEPQPATTRARRHAARP